MGLLEALGKIIHVLQAVSVEGALVSFSAEQGNLSRRKHDLYLTSRAPPLEIISAEGVLTYHQYLGHADRGCS